MRSRPSHTPTAAHPHLLPLLLAVCLTVTLCACGATAEDLQGYQKQTFAAHVCGEWRGTAFEGELTHTAADATATDTAPATVTLTFTAPTAWQGITLNLSGNTATVSLGDLSYDLPGGIGGTWFEIPALFTAAGDILSVTADGGLTEITLNSPGMGQVRVTVDGETGTVRRIAGTCGRVELG